MTKLFLLTGTEAQHALVQRAIDRCDFDFDKCIPSVAREGKEHVRVDWEDLSRYSSSDANAEGAHDHIHDGKAVGHPIERVVDGRRRVLGLFYLPPYTRIVLDSSLSGELAQEVFLAEGAHLADYHFMDAADRRAFVNLIHTQQLPADAPVHDGAAFNLDGHQCSWFDVNTYAWWCGEAFMEGFIEGTSDIPVTINLAHPVGAEDRAAIRRFLEIAEPVPEDPAQPDPTTNSEEAVALIQALQRFLETRTGQKSPRYLRDAATAWLASVGA